MKKFAFFTLCLSFLGLSCFGDPSAISVKTTTAPIGSFHPDKFSQYEQVWESSYGSSKNLQIKQDQAGKSSQSLKGDITSR
jgi:hypothetical protein